MSNQVAIIDLRSDPRYIDAEEMRHMDECLDRKNLPYRDSIGYYLNDYDWNQSRIKGRVKNIWRGEWTAARASKRSITHDMRKLDQYTGSRWEDLVAKIRGRLQNTYDEVSNREDSAAPTGGRPTARDVGTTIIVGGYKLPLIASRESSALEMKDTIEGYISGHRDDMYVVDNILNVANAHPEYIESMKGIIERGRSSNTLLPMV